jgi:hypothetical protein
MNGLPNRPPLRAPGNIVAYSVGANAFVAALAALHQQGRTGSGTLVEVAAVDPASDSSETEDPAGPYCSGHAMGSSRSTLARTGRGPA